MNLLMLILAITALTAVGWVGAALVDLVRTDGYGHRPARQAPRSHHPDPFDPARFPTFPGSTSGPAARPTQHGLRRHAA
jgi:hypothetical protein